MKILHLIPFFSPMFGGSVNTTYLQARKLSERNHEVTILTTDFNFDLQYANNILAEGVTVIPFPCIANFGLFIYTPSMKKWLEKNLKEFDIVHIHNYRSYQSATIIHFAIKMEIPYIVQAHGSLLPFFEKQFLKKCFDAIWGHNILKNAVSFIALTETEFDQYVKMGVPKNKIMIIPNGIDISHCADLPPRGQFRLKYQIPENERMILFLGRIHKIKGIDLLVEAFSKIHSQISDIRLVIAGPDGGSLFQIQRQIRKLHLENNVIFTGPLYGKDKLEAYIDADVFVLPSRYETFPNSILEAWACGTPVITTKNCQILDYIEEAGYSIEDNPVDLANVIRKILSENEKNELHVKQNNGKRLVLNELNIENTISKIESLYYNVLTRDRLKKEKIWLNT
jgi:glycosyltransferase involved in cell wall biosynthesis